LILRNIRTDLHVFFFFCWVLADDADKLIGRRNCQCGGWLGKLLRKNSSMLVPREAGDGVEMSCGDWTGARGDGWRAEVAFFSSEDFLLEHDELRLEEMGM